MIPEDFPHLERQEERLTRAMSHLPARTHERIRAALAFAREAHAGQVRAGVSRVPYIIHPLRVACTLVDEFGVRNADAVVAALLHDVVEDCGVTPEAIGERFGYTVRRYVAALTWQKGSRNEKWALAASILRQPYTVRMIKAADVIDNSRATWEVRDRARLLRWIYEYGHWGRRIVESVGAPATLMLDAALRKTTSFHFGNDPEPALPPNNGKKLTVTLSTLHSRPLSPSYPRRDRIR